MISLWNNFPNSNSFHRISCETPENLYKLSVYRNFLTRAKLLHFILRIFRCIKLFVSNKTKYQCAAAHTFFRCNKELPFPYVLLIPWTPQTTANSTGSCRGQSPLQSTHVGKARKKQSYLKEFEWKIISVLTLNLPYFLRYNRLKLYFLFIFYWQFFKVF